MDEVVEQFEKTKKQWDESYAKTQHHINSNEHYGKSKDSSTPTASNSLPRLNGRTGFPQFVCYVLETNTSVRGRIASMADDIRSCYAIQNNTENGGKVSSSSIFLLLNSPPLIN